MMRHDRLHIHDAFCAGICARFSASASSKSLIQGICSPRAARISRISLQLPFGGLEMPAELRLGQRDLGLLHRAALVARQHRQLHQRRKVPVVAAGLAFCAAENRTTGRISAWIGGGVSISSISVTALTPG